MKSQKDRSLFSAVVLIFLLFFSSFVTSTHIHIESVDKHECQLCIVHFDLPEIEPSDLIDHALNIENEKHFLNVSQWFKTTDVWFGARFPNGPPLHS